MAVVTMQGLALTQAEFDEAMSSRILPASASAPNPSEKDEDQFISWKGSKTGRNLDSMSTEAGETISEDASTGASLLFARTMPGHHRAQFVFG
jgi:hypothetical protein